MARVVMTLLGLGLFGAGIWLTIAWWEEVRIVLLALVAVGLLLCGAVLLIFGISELAGHRDAQPAPPADDEADPDAQGN